MRRLFKTLFLSALVAWAIGFTYFVHLFDSFPKLTSVDSQAIVVLTGGTGRIEDGADLLHKKKGAQLFITGVDPIIQKRDLARFLKLSKNQTNCCLTLGYEAQDTQGNAKETNQWIKQNNIKSIALVTAHYHLPRSLLEFESILSDIKITPVPVVPDLFKAKAKYAKKTLVIAHEFNKFLVASTRIYMMNRL